MNTPFKSPLQEIWKGRAFVLRNFYMLQRDFSWFLTMLGDSFCESATFILIGVMFNDSMAILFLALGVVNWSFFSALFSEIAYTVSQERRDGVLEETLALPISRLSHLLGVTVFAWLKALLHAGVIALGLKLFAGLDLSGANLAGVALTMLLGSLSVIGLGLIVAAFPLVSAERGEQAQYTLQRFLVLISAVFYPVSVLPEFLQRLALLSPITHAMNASRQLMGIGVHGSRPGALMGQSLLSVGPELGLMLSIGLLSIPVGLGLFSAAEYWAKKTGRLKRTG